MYWKIENWKVVEFYRQLPRVIWNTSLWKNITNKKLKEFWILPVVWNSPVLEEWQSYWEPTYEVKEIYEDIEKEVEVLKEEQIEKTRVIDKDYTEDDELEYETYFETITVSKDPQEFTTITEKILVDAYIIETKEVIDESLEEYKSKKIKTLSKRCRADIIAEYTEDDQRNAIARATELLDKKLDWIITEEEKEELNEIKQIKVFIDTRLWEYHNQRDDILAFDTYKEVKDYVDSLYLNEEE